jgi:hypothetical protein
MATMNPNLPWPAKGIEWHGHVDPSARIPSYSPKGRGAAVTQHRFRTAGENCRHPATFAIDIRAPNRVNAARQQMQASPRQSVLNRVRAKPQIQELRPRDNPMLLTNQPPPRLAR